MSDYLKKRQEWGKYGKPAKEKKVYHLPKKIANKIQEEKETKVAGTKEVGKYELQVWFDTIRIKHFTYSNGRGMCMECGEMIQEQFSRHATAHLLPKKLFKSVATHELNYLILGAGCGCHEKTHRVDKFIQMKIWPEAAGRIKILIPLLPMDELRFLSNQLLTALDNTP